MNMSLEPICGEVSKVLYVTMMIDRAMPHQNLFSQNDLLQYMDSMLRQSKTEYSRRTNTSNYSWLRSKSLETPHHNLELEEFKSIILKMSSESCAMTAVKLDSLSAKTPADMVAGFRQVLVDQQHLELLAGSVKRAKEKRRKANRVHPELSPPGRQPTVSFILN